MENAELFSLGDPPEIQDLPQDLPKEIVLPIEGVVDLIEEEDSRAEMGMESLEPKLRSFLLAGHVDMPDFNQFEPFGELSAIKEKIKAIPPQDQSDARRKLIIEFKKKMRTFRAAIACAQYDLEKLFLRDKSVDTWEELQAKTETIIKKYSLSYAKRYFYYVILRFFEAHQAVQKVVRDYQEKFGKLWPAKLFEDLFSRPPFGTVEEVVLPTALYLKLHNEDDYVLAFTSCAVFNGLVSPSDSRFQDEERKARRSSGGKFVGKLPIKELENRLLIENVQQATFPEGTQRHEEEHAIHDFYPNSSMLSYDIPDFGKENITVEEFLAAVERYAEWQLQRWDSSARSEILAFMKVHENFGFISYSLLGNDDLYNYLKQDQPSFLEAVKLHLKNANITIRTKEGSILDSSEIVEMILNILENSWQLHLQATERAITAAEKLSKDSSIAGAINLLRQEPMNKWPRLAKLMG